MLRIAGVVLPGQKRIVIALMYIRGIGKSLAQKILKETKIDENRKTDTLTEEEGALLRVRIEQETVEGDLARKVSMDIRRLQEIGTWVGYRHRKKLPVRGQTSRRNARTKRGKKKTGSSGRVKLTKT